MLDEKTQLEYAGLVHKKTGIETLSLITGVKYGTSLVKSFNNMTFLYDPNWEYESGNPTYPISFFYIKSLTESMTSDVSAKPMLFYNSGSDSKEGTASGLLNIIADNIVIKPKTYKLDVLIPANSSTFENISLSNEEILKAYADYENMTLARSGIAREYTAMDDNVKRITTMALDTIRSLLKGLYGSALSVTAVCNMLLQQQDYNKASIEYMWRNRRILGLKSWNSWKFKYLVIQNFEVTKVGENGSFYEGSITCQEVPILTFRNQEKSSLGIMSTISSYLGKAQKVLVQSFVDTMTASLGE